ncbi:MULTISPECIES: DUF2273 domain-containing protein [unclassified Serinicoccus]|jgi:hypothetical protein|uniref:DUF2273 domain-containing protein n=1 Tax=unclassified Serinicoccus TaxID=2643101 RepID=UPI0038555087
MNTATTGLLVGLLLALIGILGGLGGFLLALVLGGVGYAVAGQLSGEVDLTAALRGRRG